jgi:hypothetical protein
MMKTGISRRAVLNGLGQSAALGSLAAVLPAQLLAAQAATAPATKPPAAKPAAAPKPAAKPAAPVQDVALLMLYPAGEGLTFDADGFRDRHMAVLKTAYAGGLERIELRVPPPPVEGATPSPILAAVSMWISDFTKFAAGANAHAKEVSASMASITRSAPIAQFDYVIAGVGVERAAVQAETRCLSMFFEAKEGATWDAKGFARDYLPKLVAAFGPEAVQRAEIVQGEAATNGGKPLLLGTVNLYIADPAKFVEASASEAVKVLAPEEAKYYSVRPIQTLMQVHAVG